MAIIEERGLFWWADDLVVAQQITPNSAVAGLLTIDDNGAISLELDGNLPSKHGPMSAMVQRELPADKRIRGLLKVSGQHVLLTGLRGNGGRMRSNGISYERYISSACLVSEREPVSAKQKFKRIIIPLSGYEEWLRLRAIKVKQTRRMVSAKYKRLKDVNYQLADGSLTIQFDLSDLSSNSTFGAEISMKEIASASLRFTSAFDLEGIQTQFQLFEDLLILLTTADYALDWPWIGLTKKDRCRLYFRRLRDRASGVAPRYSECVANFVQLHDSFGSMWETWRRKREQLGPGLYLYLGTRRGISLYVEHRFVNLIWGIEAFHRRKYPASTTDPLKHKVDRILGQITAKKDKKWLSKKLENAHEPSLSERIFQTISAIPLGLDSTRLRAFADACAKARNDISHFGGGRHDQDSYNKFMIELLDKNEALSTLYQMLLLQELEVSAKLLKSWVFDGFRSYPIKVHFARAGLIDKSDIEPKAIKPKSPNQVLHPFPAT